MSLVLEAFLERHGLGWGLSDGGIVDETVVVEAPIDLLGNAIEQKTDGSGLNGSDTFVDEMLFTVSSWSFTKLNLHFTDSLTVHVEVNDHILKVVGETWLEADKLESITTWDKNLGDDILDFPWRVAVDRKSNHIGQMPPSFGWL